MDGSIPQNIDGTHHIIFTMVAYFLRWTLLKIFSSFPDEQSQQKVRQLDRITAQWLIHQMKLRARYCGNFEFIIFSLRILERVGSIVNIRNECLFSGFAVHAICLSRATIHSPWTQKKRHSFLKCVAVYCPFFEGIHVPPSTEKLSQSFLKSIKYKMVNTDRHFFL